MTEAQAVTMITAITPLYPFLFALAAVLFKWLITKLPEDRQTEVNQVVQTVVQGVEQQCGSGSAGAEKKQMAVNMVSTILSNLHITTSTALIDAMIEAAVYGINQSQATNLPAVPVNQAVQAANAMKAVPVNG